MSQWSWGLMSDDDLKRKLTVAFSADAVGYSRLMGNDETATVKTIEEYKRVMAGLIQAHGGRVVDSTGDNLLAEFASVVDAVKCAVAVQRELRERNGGLCEQKRMHFRIGINLGDVIEKEGRIYGDGVNIAARLESLADPGGICVSKTVIDQVENKLPFTYKYLGEKKVKNIEKPIPSYSVLFEAIEKPETSCGAEPVKCLTTRRWKAFAIAAFLVALGLAVLLYVIASKEIAPAPAVSLVGEATGQVKSIVVLPFNNLSPDPEQDFLSDGLTEDIITALSAIPRLFVVARNTSFTLKGKPVNAKSVGQELGVGYILEGSIQTEAGMVRITAQLIDAVTGNHLWAERYDRELKDIFALQDDITLKIMESLQLTIMEGEGHGPATGHPKSLDAYLKLLKAKFFLMSSKRADNEKARQLLEEAILIDPEYPSGYALLARTYLREAWLAWSSDSANALSRALEFAEKALSLDPYAGVHHALMSQIYLFQGLYDKALIEAERAVSLSPGSVEGYISLGMTRYFRGQFAEALLAYKDALRFDPSPPGGLYYQIGNSYLMMEDYQEAKKAYARVLSLNPNNLWAYVGFASLYSMSGLTKEAIEAGKKVIEINPYFSLKNLEEISPYRNPAHKERLLDALRKAGLK